MQIYHYTLIKNFHIARKCWYEHDFTKYYTLKRLNITVLKFHLILKKILKSLRTLT